MVDHLVQIEGRSVRVLALRKMQPSVGSERGERDIAAKLEIVSPSCMAERRVAGVGKGRVRVGSKARPIGRAGLGGDRIGREPGTASARFRDAVLPGVAALTRKCHS